MGQPWQRLSQDHPVAAFGLTLAQPQSGDTMVVPALDRYGRSLKDLVNMVGELRARGIGFTSLHERLDTTTPGGRLIFHVFAALAEFIRELIVSGTREGLAAGRARGNVGGRPVVATPTVIPSRSSRCRFWAHLGWTPTVVLTTAHLDHTPENCDPGNLRAMCQGCHLHYDRDHHARTRAEIRRTALEAAGQMTFEL